MSSRKVIITCAITGSIHTPSMSPHLPVTAEEIAEAAIGAAEAGAADRPSARARSEGRSAGPVARAFQAVSRGHQAAVELRGEHHHRRRSEHDDRGAAEARRPVQARGRLAQHGLDELRSLSDARPLQGRSSTTGSSPISKARATASSRTPSPTSKIFSRPAPTTAPVSRSSATTSATSIRWPTSSSAAS